MIAVSAAALTAQTKPGAERLEIALAGAREPSRITAHAASSLAGRDLQVARLSAAVRELSVDRDRLKARLASLERALDDTTGTITRQVKEVAVVAETAAKKQAAMLAAPAGASQTVPAAAPARPVTIISMPLIAVPSFNLKPAPPYGPAAAQWSNAFVQQPRPASPQQVASIASHSNVKPKEVASVKKEFAADVGGSATIAALWRQWVGIKASYGPLLTGLEPRYRRHRHEAGPPEYRLLVGPFADAPSANRLCSILATVHVDCHATTFDGAHLAAQ